MTRLSSNGEVNEVKKTKMHILCRSDFWYNVISVCRPTKDFSVNKIDVSKIESLVDLRKRS